MARETIVGQIVRLNESATHSALCRERGQGPPARKPSQVVRWVACTCSFSQQLAVEPDPRGNAGSRQHPAQVEGKYTDYSQELLVYRRERDLRDLRKLRGGNGSGSGRGNGSSNDNSFPTTRNARAGAAAGH